MQARGLPYLEDIESNTDGADLHGQLACTHAHLACWVRGCRSQGRSVHRLQLDLRAGLREVNVGMRCGAEESRMRVCIQDTQPPDCSAFRPGPATQAAPSHLLGASPRADICWGQGMTAAPKASINTGTGGLSYSTLPKTSYSMLRSWQQSPTSRRALSASTTARSRSRVAAPASR